MSTPALRLLRTAWPPALVLAAIVLGWDLAANARNRRQSNAAGHS